MRSTPINENVVHEMIDAFGVHPVGRASIREIVKIVNDIEVKTGERFIRMEMGVPGLDPASVGVEAEIEALKRGIASVYPNIEGIPSLKKEISRFVRLFMDIDVPPECCIPTVGSMMGGMASFMVVNRSDRNRTGTLFLDPGFPVQKQQCLVLGHSFGSFDFYDYRGDKLEAKLESEISKGHYSSILYSNPNNPAWICLTEQELEIIARVASKYDVTVIEDLAYFGMDFRKDFSRPGEPPYQPTVARYMDNWVLLISSSKAFSYAGQRVGMMVVSPTLYNRRFPDLTRYYSSEKFGHAMIYGALYALSAGAAHSCLLRVAGIVQALHARQYTFFHVVEEYPEKARLIKSLFLKYGFQLVYEKDLDQPIADGFYFTISYPGFSGDALVEELLFYGISAISLDITGSAHPEGLRACVSMVGRDQFGDLEKRLQGFRKDHPV